MAVSPAKQLDGFLAKFTPKVRAQGKRALKTMRQRVPGAIELIYDNYYALVIGFGPNERPSDAIFSVVLYPNHVTLCFLCGVELDDPGRVLKGGGHRIRHIRLEDPAVLDRADVKALIAQAVDIADPPFDRRGRRKQIVRSIAKRQQPRRPRL